jgi:hypothetical protein
LETTGAGQPDFGLYVTNQVQKGEPRKGQVPERGVIEMKPVKDDAWLTANTKQVSKYWGAYRLVIVTNLRDFLILGEDANNRVARLETFRLAKSAADFWEMVATPQKSAKQIGRAFGEYLRRALTQSVALREPKGVAWFLASYARDALQRVEKAGDLPALAGIRSSLEEALGVTFESDRGEHFFRSTLVQTLFYGVFSAWVLWARSTPRPSPHFDWHISAWHLNVPFVTTLFQQLASPAQLQPLHLVEVLDWTAATLNRVNADAFISRFNDADAVQFFYEPFLEAFDPELRKELGVWYTPTEVITYMVARVDRALREELGVADGLASEQVYILDPCCGTGGYLTAALKRIDTILSDRGLGALKAQMVKKAATTRVFGFEILPAPFVVAHLKIGLVLKSLRATLEADRERVGVYLTNALTGWTPVTAKPLPFPGLEEERKKADNVKQEAPILVILGNPPYNGFAGMAQELPEERGLSLAYRTTRKVRSPEGQGLNDLYVRFYRMAEHRIAEKTGRGIVCFISNYSWLDGLSFTGMRERYLEAFDTIRIDCLNGDKFKTGKTTPEGLPDPSIFSTEHNREGIQVGTAIATMIRKEDHSATSVVAFRHLWGTAKRQELLETADAESAALYQTLTPSLELGLPYVQVAVGEEYHRWPRLPELLPTSFPGVQNKRDSVVVDIDEDRLRRRIHRYFDASIPDDALKADMPEAFIKTAQYDPKKTRARMDWPRVPVPADAKRLGASADLGAQLARLLNADTPIEGLTRGKLRPGIRVLGLPHKKSGKPLDDSDLSLSASWGHMQTSRTGSTLVMPGLGLVNERDYTPAERAALEQEGKALGMTSDAVLGLLGNCTLGVHMNADAMWTNVPAKVWEYTLGGYQVIKKWLSYREKEILGRALKPDEVAYVSEMVRRIAGILLLSPALDANYVATKADAVEWKDGRPVA